MADITTGELHQRMLISWNLPPDYAAILDRYYLLHWSREWFIRKTKTGGIDHQGIFYSVIFAPNQTIRDVINADQVAISFRKMHTQKYGYAMVKGLKEPKESNHV